MIHAIIVDDEINGLKSLELLIREFEPEVSIVETTTDPEEAISIINLYRPDIVFLDINMPKLNGFEMLDQLEYRDFYLVFTTAHKQYGLQALKQNATDYLLKPVDIRELRKAIEAVKHKMAENQQKPNIYQLLKDMYELQNVKVHLPTKTSTEFVSLADIIYVEADSKYALVGLTNGSIIEVTNGLKEYEQQLCRKELRFLRIHNSFIINLDYAVRLMKDGSAVTMKGKKIIPVSRQKKDELLRTIQNGFVF
jgi:two-component system LytT family response regulator